MTSKTFFGQNKKAISIISGILLLGIIVVLVISAFVGLSLLTPFSGSVDTEPPEEMIYEEVEFESKKNDIKLEGWYFKGIDGKEATKSTVIFAHGYGQNRLVDEVGLSLAKDLLQEGHRVFTFDFRNSGESEGDTTTIGQFEKYDLLGAVDYVSEEKPIILHGFSMGASTAIIAAEEDPRVHGVIADSPFHDLENYLEANLSYWTKLPSFPFNWIILNLAPVITELEPEKVSPIETVENLDKPLLLIHGDEDVTIPHHDSKKIKEASPEEDTQLVIIPGAEHVVGYLEDEDKYLEAVLDFLEQFH